MSNHKKHQLIFLPISLDSEAENCLIAYHHAGKLSYTDQYLTKEYRKVLNVKCFHLYVLSENRIKKEDLPCYVFHEGTNTVQFINENGITIIREVNQECKKIVASTDKNLNWKISSKLPQIPKDFINYFINEYNKGNIVTEVEVDYSKTMNGTNTYNRLRVNADNTINIKPIKNSWSKEEVKIEFKKFLNQQGNNILANLMLSDVDSWIETNLK